MRYPWVFVLVAVLGAMAIALRRGTRSQRVDDRAMRRLADLVERGELRVVPATVDDLPVRCRTSVDAAAFQLTGYLRTLPGTLPPTWRRP